MRKKAEHFDVTTLLRAIDQQDIGLKITTNHPEGFRRLVYLHMRQHPNQPKVSILQDPDSPNAFMLVKEQFKLEQANGS